MLRSYDRKWTKPLVLLINNRSYSDAEIFPNAFRTLGLGKLVGQPTGGYVIGTAGVRLIDGSTFRIPRIGVYTTKGVNMDKEGVQPDVLVETASRPARQGHRRATGQGRRGADEGCRRVEEGASGRRGKGRAGAGGGASADAESEIDKQTRRLGELHNGEGRQYRFSLSPCLLVSLSPCLPGIDSRYGQRAPVARLFSSRGHLQGG